MLLYYSNPQLLIISLRNREKARSYLLKRTGTMPEEDCMKLFYTRQEREEIF